MKVLYIIKRDPDATARELIERHGEQADVSIVDLRVDKDYDGIVREVFGNDRVICW